MKKKILRIIMLLSLVFTVALSYSQPYVFNNKELDKLKKSKLYVVMAMENTDINNEYYDVFKETWNYCPYEVIEPSEILNYMEEDVFFMHLSVSFLSTYREYSRFSKAFFNFELTLYTPHLSFLKKLEKKSTRLKNLDLSDIAFKIAKINLKADDSKRFMYWEPLETDFMGKGFLLSNGPGILKNYLQLLQKQIKNKIFWEEQKDFYNEKEIHNLKRVKLYIPEELLKGYAKRGEDKGDDDEKDFNMDEIAKDYNYPGKYEVVPMSKINELIMNSEEPFYYMSLYSYNNGFNTGNTMTITNSATGDIIFKESVMTSRSFSPKLFKKLSKMI